MGVWRAPIGRLVGGLVLLCSWVAGAQGGVGHDSSGTWRTLSSQHFAVHYRVGEEALALRTIAIAEQVHERLAPRFRWTPAQRTDIILTDEYDVSNGYAQVVPDNRMTLFLAPPDELNSLEDHGGWLDTLITHEYIHILHLDKAAGAPRLLRKIFGRHFLLFPNTLQPRWLIEGLATYGETDHDRGIGRGQSSYFDMIMRLESDAGLKPLHQINQPIATWPSGIVPYLYGVKFYDFLVERYDPKRVDKLVENYSDNLLPFMINSNSRRSLGKNLKQLWPEFDAHLRAHYGPQLAAVRDRGIHAGERLSHHGYMTGASRLAADGTLYYISYDAADEPGLLRLPAGETRARRLTDVAHGTRLDLHSEAGILLAQPDLHRNANLYYDLYRVDPRRGSMRRLTRGGRYRHAAWLPDGTRILAVRLEKGRHSLEVLDAEGVRQETLWTSAPGEAIGDLSFLPDGSAVVAAVWRPASGWDLEQFSLDSKQWKRLTRDATIEAQPQVSADGRSVLYTSDHGGIYNLRRLDLKSGTVTTLSNVEGGAFYPQQANPGGPIYYTGYTAQGFDIFRLDPKSLPTPKGSQGASGVAAAPAAIPVGLKDQGYRPWSGLAPRWWFPHLVVDSGRAELGAMSSGWDALQRHRYVVDTAYDVKNEWFVGALDYVYDRWYPVFKLHAARSSALELDTHDEPLLLRRSDTYQTEVVFPWLSLRSRWSINATALLEKESARPADDQPISSNDLQDSLVGFALIHDSTRRYPLSVSRANGRQVHLVWETSDTIGGSDYSGEVYTVDWREFLALPGQHVLAARIAGGWGSKDPRPFRLGGSRSAAASPGVLDDVGLNSPFNQRRYALRGYRSGQAQLTGRRMVLSSLEWRFPIHRLERGWMAPPLGLHQVYGTVFAETASVWDEGRRPGPYRTGAGVEANADVVLFYNLGLNLRVGYAHGFEEFGKDQVYISLGAAF